MFSTVAKPAVRTRVSMAWGHCDTRCLWTIWKCSGQWLLPWIWALSEARRSGICELTWFEWGLPLFRGRHLLRPIIRWSTHPVANRRWVTPWVPLRVLAHAYPPSSWILTWPARFELWWGRAKKVPRHYNQFPILKFTKRMNKERKRHAHMTYPKFWSGLNSSPFLALCLRPNWFDFSKPSIPSSEDPDLTEL